MRRVIISLALAALLGAAVPAWAQSDDEAVIRALKESLRKKLDRVRKEMEGEIDRAFVPGGQSTPAVQPPKTATQPPAVTSEPPKTAPTTPAERPKLGFTVYDNVPGGVQRLHKLEAGQGLMIKEVTPGGLSEAAGLKPNDILLAIDQTPINSKDDLRSAASALKVGSKVTLNVARGTAAGSERVALPVQYGASAAGAGNIPPELLQNLPPGVTPEDLQAALGDPQRLQELLGGQNIPPELQDLLADPEALQQTLQEFLGQGDPRQSIREMLGGQDPNELLQQFFPDGAPEGIKNLLDSFLADPNQPPAGQAPAPGATPETPAAPAGDSLDQFFQDMFPAETPQPTAPLGPPTLAFKGSTAPDGGVAVTGLTAGGPAAQGGLQVGDVITKIGDIAIASTADLGAAMKTLAPGQKIKVTVRRGQGTKTLTVTVGVKK